VKKLGVYRLYVGFVLLYLLVLLIMPPNPETIRTYHLSTTAYRVLLLVVVAVPAFLTWLAAFYGYNQLAKYVELLKNTPESEGFERLLKGIKWMALYLPIVSLTSIILAAFANRNLSWRPLSVVLSTYLTIVIALVAFTAVSGGARLLSDAAKARPTAFKVRLLTLSFIILGVFYCYFIIKHGIDMKTSPYQMPLAVLLATVVVPYFYAWMLGLLAVLDIDAYATNISGLLYRKSLQLLSAGLLVVVLSSVLVQYLNSASTQRGRLILGGVLVIKYILYACLAAGFALIAHSAKKLQQIEKI
jgi:hypothetical protein